MILNMTANLCKYINFVSRVKSGLGTANNNNPTKFDQKPWPQLRPQLRVSPEIINTMEAEIDYSKIEFAPAFPLPLPFDVKKRIQQLRSFLEPNNPHFAPEYQHTNIKVAIKLYEEGKIDGTEKVSIKDGNIVTREEAFKGPTAFMYEGRGYQFAEKHA